MSPSPSTTTLPLSPCPLSLYYYLIHIPISRCYYTTSVPMSTFPILLSPYTHVPISRYYYTTSVPIPTFPILLSPYTHLHLPILLHYLCPHSNFPYTTITLYMSPSPDITTLPLSPFQLPLYYYLIHVPISRYYTAHMDVI